ncbi:uncharacterized protein isoform X3 [Castor canadensis]|uniref:Uncharacterized protein isoform X3 n=1 Tax=Castor canadensis TaxID=51338 RepID=A0AC58L3E1_CASCN
MVCLAAVTQFTAEEHQEAPRLASSPLQYYLDFSGTHTSHHGQYWPGLCSCCPHEWTLGATGPVIQESCSPRSMIPTVHPLPAHAPQLREEPQQKAAFLGPGQILHGAPHLQDLSVELDVGR